MQTRRPFQRAVFLALGFLLVGEAPLFAQGARPDSDSIRPAPADEIWMAFDYSNSVTGYSALATAGAMRPRRTIAGDRTGLQRPAAIAVDERGRLYVTNPGNNSVTVYAPGAAGNVAPVRTLRGPATGLATPRGVALDPHGALYVVNESRDRVTVYAPGADGDAVPIRSIWGSRTRLTRPTAVAVDRYGATYVTGHWMGYVVVFAPGANGNARPAREFRSTAYGPVGMKSLLWRGVAMPGAIALDRAGRLYVAYSGASKSGPEVQVYPSNARGITASLRTISGDRTALEYPIGVTIDAGGFVYVLNQSTTHSVTVYAPSAAGDAPPIVKLEADASGRSRPSPWDRTVQDTAHPPSLPPAVAIYPPGAAGDVAPRQEITGERTRLLAPVTLGLGGDRTVYVLNCDGRVTVYPSGTHGDAAPIREFGKASLPVDAFPTGLALDRSDTAFISYVWQGDRIHPGRTEVYAPGSEGDSPPRRQIDWFAARFNGLVIDAHDYLYAGLGESGFSVMHKSRVARPGVPVGVTPEAPDADPSTPGWDYYRHLSLPDDEVFWPGHFALDSHQRLYLPSRDDIIRVYATATPGRFRLMHTLAGPRTELDEPAAVALGLGDTLFVANAGSARGPSVTIYAPNARGDVPPVRTLRGARTGLGASGALAIDATGRLYVLRKSPPEKRCAGVAR